MAVCKNKFYYFRKSFICFNVKNVFYFQILNSELIVDEPCNGASQQVVDLIDRLDDKEKGKICNFFYFLINWSFKYFVHFISYASER